VLGPAERIEQQREKVRTGLAIGLGCLLALTVVGVATFLAADYINGEEAGLILGPVATLAGTVFGFYFAGRAP